MELEIRPLRKRDYSRAMQFAVTGMHFDRYMSSGVMLKLYSRYFLYMELERSSQVIAAYYGDALAGVLLADMKDEPKTHHSLWREQYVRLVDFIQNTFFRSGVGPYNAANKEMLESYSAEQSLDGEICFLAANPDIGVKGIGTLLLGEFERREPGKRIIL